MNKTLKIGSKVVYRGAWGTAFPKESEIEGIQLCENGDKYGEDIEECNEGNYENCVFDLTDGHWCYGYQIDWKDSVKLNN